MEKRRSCCSSLPSPSLPSSSSPPSLSVQQPLQRTLLIAVVFSAVTGFLLGFDLSIVAVVLNPINDEFSLCGAKELTCLKKEIFVAMIAPGALVGSIAGGVLADFYGRRIAVAVSDLLFIFGSVAFYFAKSWGGILTARCIVGSGVGVGFVVFSTYITEIAPPEKRGRLVLCQEIAQCIGVTITFLVGAIVDDSHWRLLLLSGSLGAILQLVGMPYLPESPRWLLLQGNIVHARQVMRYLEMSEDEVMMDYCEFDRSNNRGLATPLSKRIDVEEETNEQDLPGDSAEAESLNQQRMVAGYPGQLSISRFRVSIVTHESDKCYPISNDLEGAASSVSIRKASTLMRLWSCRRALLVASVVGIAQNVLCTNASLYFATDLMLLANICKPYQWGIGLGVMKLLGTIVTYNLVDSLGRRCLLLCGTTGLGVMFLILAGGYSLVPMPPDVSEAGLWCLSPAGASLGPSGLAAGYSVIVLSSLFGLLFFWEISWAGLMYVVASEILPSDVRGTGMGIVVACFWISLFFSQLCFELSFTFLQVPGTFVGLAVASLLVIAFTFFSVPDLTGQSLAKINRLMIRQSSRVI